MLFPFFFSSFVELLKNYLAQVLHFYLFSSGFCVVNVIKIAFSWYTVSYIQLFYKVIEA